MNESNNNPRQPDDRQPLKDGAAAAGPQANDQPGEQLPDAYRENEKIYTQNQGGGLYGVVGAAGEQEDPQPGLKKEDEEEPDYRTERDDFENYKDSERGSTDENRSREY